MSKRNSVIMVSQNDNSQFVTSIEHSGGNDSPVGPRERARLQPLTEAAWEAEYERRRSRAQ